MNLNRSYTGSRPDIMRLLPEKVDTIVDFGCSVGTLGRDIKRESPATTVAGFEYDAVMARQAEAHLDEVFVGDLDSTDLTPLLQYRAIDCMIFADVLEHLKDPWAVLASAASHLRENGTVIASIPNIRHVSTIHQLVLNGYWPYRDRGIHDKTHLRFFTLRNIHELFAQAGLDVHGVHRNFRFVEAGAKVDKYARYLNFWPIRDFLTFQYLVVARKSALQPRDSR